MPGIGKDWSKDTTTIKIEIKPLFWQQAWFMPMLFLLAGLLLVGLYRWRLGQVRCLAL